MGYITNSNLHTESGVSFPTKWRLTPPPLPVDLALLKQGKDENWAQQGEMPFASFRKASQKTQFHFPRHGQSTRNTADEWVRLTTGENWTNATLGFLVDMFPMPVEAFLHDDNPYDVKGSSGSRGKAAKFWYPTLLLNIDIKKALPDEGVEWLFSRVVTKQIKNGRMDIEITILDEAEEVVALSHHVAFAVGTERNLAERKTGGTSKI